MNAFTTDLPVRLAAFVIHVGLGRLFLIVENGGSKGLELLAIRC